MSLRDRFVRITQKEAKADALAAAVELIDKTFSTFTDEFPAELEKIIQRAQAGKKPPWFNKPKTSVSFTCKGIACPDLSIEAFEQIPGFRKLRNACAAPETDMAFELRVLGAGSTTHACVYVTLMPDKPFSESYFLLEQSAGREKDFPMTPLSAEPAPPAPVVETGQAVPIMRPLKVKQGTS